MTRAYNPKTKACVKPIFAELRARRIKMNISQTDLAVALGYTDRAVSSWENGAREPTMNALIDWASFFGLKLTLMEANRDQ